jgi:hypothetical protein
MLDLRQLSCLLRRVQPAQVASRQIPGRGRINDLHQLALLLQDARPQYFMAADDMRKG